MDAVEKQVTLLQQLRTAYKPDKGVVEVPKSVFAELLAELVSADFDEGWYLSTYRDVSKAIKDKAVSSALAHYVQFGFFEGRLPFPVPVDETDYMKRHPDVDDAVKKGAFADGETHFMTIGFAEGRSFRLVRA